MKISKSRIDYTVLSQLPPITTRGRRTECFRYLPSLPTVVDLCCRCVLAVPLNRLTCEGRCEAFRRRQGCKAFQLSYIPYKARLPPIKHSNSIIRRCNSYSLRMHCIAIQNHSRDNKHECMRASTCEQVARHSPPMIISPIL